MNKLPTFHCGALETFSGPAIGTFSDIINLPLKARQNLMDGKPVTTGGDLLNIIYQNTPYANLSYARPALDTLFLNALRTTGFAKSMQAQYAARRRNYGQTHIDPYQFFMGKR